MAFTKTTWVDGSAPGITAAQLNRIETGIDEAHERVFSAHVATATTVLSNGWTVSRLSTDADVRITHNLGHTDYSVVATARYPYSPVNIAVAQVAAVTTTHFDVGTARWVLDLGDGTVTNELGPAFDFILVLHG